ncbi:MAG: cytochrome C [Desulfuromonadales bacterium]|nr:MAG: cytochrome C [Desulfuromonadales bacterium]
MRLHALAGRKILFAVTLLLAVFAYPHSSPAQMETVCLQCHEPQPGKGGAPVKKWRESIHAENGISCHDCHGGDPKDSANAMSPARGFLGVPKESAIPAFCGRCHVGISEDYLKSAHGRALGKGGPSCVTCHDAHATKKVTLDIINEKLCSRCHSYDRAAEIKEAMRQTETLITGIDRSLQEYKGQGVDTDAREKGLFALRNRYHRLFHEVDTAKVKHESSQIQAELQKIQQSLDKVNEQRHRRKIAGLFVIGASLLAALLVHLLRKTV